MRKFSKAGLLIVTLVIPALIFVFLKFFAKNHYDLPYFNPELDTQGNVVITNGDTLFKKVNAVCPAIEDVDIKGKLTLIGSLPGDCDDKDCQVFITQLKRIRSLKSGIPELQIMALVDTLQETSILPEEIGANKKWITLSAGMINECLKISPSSIPAGRNNDAKWRLMLVDTQGYIRGYFNGKDVKDIDRLMAEIKILDYEGKATK